MRSWPVLLLLVVVVLVPTIGVLWFMSQAMRNERLAVRQKLGDVYQAQLLGLQQELQAFWQARSDRLEVGDGEVSASRVFAERVRRDLADGIVVYGPTGRPSYPAPPRVREIDGHPPRPSWRLAESLESSGQNEAAAAHYAAIAEGTTDRDLAAQALLAQARCLVQAERVGQAVSILAEELGHPRYEGAADHHGRLIAPSAQLRALQLVGDGTDPRFRRAAGALRERLVDYGDPALPAGQRRFLMKELKGELASSAPETPAGDWPGVDSSGADAPLFDTLEAEELAVRYLDSDPPAPPTTSLQPSGLPEVWHLASPSGTVVALFEQRRLVRELEGLIARQSLPGGARVELLAPGAQPEDLFLVSMPAAGFLQDWQLVLRPEDQTLFATAAGQRINAYLLTGVLVVVVILLLAVFTARAVGRQLRLTRLKNDLLATVSHELKTPLASMRLLVDTLLDTGVHDTRRVREYLQLIAKENVRLSRLVDNFLTFSRMERNRQSFEKAVVSPGAVVEEAAASVTDRFHASGCRFEVHLTPDLPALVADHGALVAVLLNLLDNAYKYSDGERHIVLRSYRDNGQVCFAVRDNGIGLSGRVAGKIFDRFYQVDQSLSRPGSGCGLGLAIVKFIIGAHGGSVEVDSRPGAGSTFTVRLPAAPREAGDTDADGSERTRDDR